MSAQQSNQQQRPPERWKPESTEWYYPVPPKVKPGVGTGAPSDAIILFDGKDLSMWESAGKDGGPAIDPDKRLFWRLPVTYRVQDPYTGKG